MKVVVAYSLKYDKASGQLVSASVAGSQLVAEVPRTHATRKRTFVHVPKLERGFCVSMAAAW